MNKFIKSVTIITLLIFLRVGFALAADQVYFYYTDPAGTPLVMSDSTGTVVWKADYLPFGEETIDQSTVPNNKMFVGKEKDSESGLYYFGARYMDAGAGRFLSTDPIEVINPQTGEINQRILHDPQRLNLYAYGLNNPYGYLDHDGKEVGLVVPMALIFIASYITLVALQHLQPPSSIHFPDISLSKKENIEKKEQEGKAEVERPEGYWDAEKGAAEWGRINGTGAKEGKRRFHRGVKGKDLGSKGKDNYSVNPQTGDVLNPAGESVGNLNDVKGN
jgi:RHS repeat-associated protein